MSMEEEQVASESDRSEISNHQTASYPPLEPNLEEDNDGDDDDEEDGDEDETKYQLRFDGEMDPLDFIENDASGVEPYQQFQRLENEYEALAAKKRKALATSGNSAKKIRKDADYTQTFEDIMEGMSYGMGRKSKKMNKKRGRRKGSKKKVSPEVARKLGDATLHYANERYDEAICLLKEVIRLDPYLPDPYHTLGLVYNAIGDKKKQISCYMLAAHSSPKDGSLWKHLVTWSISGGMLIIVIQIMVYHWKICREEGNNEQAMYCLSKAITAEPEDISLRFHRASLYVELGDYQKAAESYEQISQLRPELVEALKTAATLYQKCCQRERAVSILEEYVKRNKNEADMSVVHLLVSIHIEGNEYLKALNHIEHAKQVYGACKELPLSLNIKAGVCEVHMGNLEKAEAIFSVLQSGNACDDPHIIAEVADSLAYRKHFELALKYYMMLEAKDHDFSYSSMAQCYLFLGDRLRSIECYYKALHKLNDGVDVRLNLASLLVHEGRDDEAISLLCPQPNPGEHEPWWENFIVKLKLSQIYKDRGSLEAFVDTIYPCVRKSFLEAMQQKDRAKKRLTRSVLFERMKVLGNRQNDNVFQGFRPMASATDLSKATRAKKLLQKKEALREEKRAAAFAAGVEWKSDDSDDELPQTSKRRHLPNLLKDEEYHCLIVDLCKALASLRKYWEALEIINLSLKLACSALSVEKKEELRSLGAQIAYNIGDPSHGWECARYIVNQHPYSFAAWNCYYKVISRFDNKYSKHGKFLHGMRTKHRDSVPPIIIFAHQLTMISQHQAAAKEYLEAHKLMPDSPLINLCAGSALINLALGHRLQNKHQCVVQGLAFLFKNLLLSENSQESLYNIARAYHHIGLVTLAAEYYEKVLSVHVDDYPIPKLPNENPDLTDSLKPGYCDLRREAAYNLHLIYKNSGAFDLARQVLKDHCSF